MTRDDDTSPAHTPLDEPHPAGDGERTDRDVGGPVAGEDAPEGPSDRPAHGTREAPFDAHE